MSNASGWTSFTGDELAAQPAKVRQLHEEARNRTPIAQVTVNVLGLGEGQSELQVVIDPNGALKDAHTGGAARSEAYAKLIEIIQREVQLGLTVLQQH
jgi:hypothetical protein